MGPARVLTAGLLSMLIGCSGKISGIEQAPPRARSAVSSLYVVDNLRRVLPSDPPPGPRERVTAASVSVARNEYEAFQLVLYGGEGALRGVDAFVAGPLVSPGGASLTASIVFYREHYVTVSSPSGEKFAGAKAGVYPDALIPFRNPFTLEPLGAPFDVSAGQNQPVYVEVYVPPDAPAGVYTGSIRVTQDGNTRLTDVPLSVTVWNFTLPAASSLRTSFQPYDAEHWLGPAQYYGYQYSSPEHRALARAIDEILIAHRLIPGNPMDTSFDWDANGNIVPNSRKDAIRLSFLRRPEWTDYHLGFDEQFPFREATTVNRQRTLNYLRSAYAWFEGYGVAAKVWLRPGDEPGDPSQLDQIAELARLAKEANPNYRVAMTLNPGNPEVVQRLYGRINRIVAAYANYDPVQLGDRLAAGDEIWTYTALTQTTDHPTPYWEIDFPLLNYRIVPWINFRYGATGILYWTTDHWGELRQRQASPWEDPCNHKPGGGCYNGDGLLLYPGKEINFIVPRDTYGSSSPASVYGPVPSLRLKALRDGIEDYQYLVMAAQVQREATQRQAIRVGCDGNANPGDAKSNCFQGWDKNPADLLNAREKLAAIIESSTRP